MSTLGGYNGLPSVLSGLDESMSDVGHRKKYPFELEKAIHNVMFIQHHMQRQDEFNAVRTNGFPFLIGFLIAFPFTFTIFCLFFMKISIKNFEREDKRND